MAEGKRLVGVGVPGMLALLLAESEAAGVEDCEA